MILGINSMGRIGKLTLWHHVARKHFSGLVVNLGRDVGKSLEDVAQVVEKDSSYGRLGQFIHGFNGGRVIENLDEQAGTMTIDGMPVKFLREHRNPREIQWRSHKARLVVDCTGVFNDPTVPADAPGGALRGHLEGGAEKVVLSAPFKIKNKGLSMPDDAVTTVMGINDEVFETDRHTVISAASCTTTCLSYMMKPLLDRFGTERLLSASMVTVHAATGSQKVLDAMPKAGAKDLRKNRSILNNIILTTTGAAKALPLVIPEMSKIGFMAESVRVPTATGSLTILTLNLQPKVATNGESRSDINREVINQIYREAAEGPYSGHLVYTSEQNVSSDMIGYPRAATVIEGQETHTRTAFIHVNTSEVANISEEARTLLANAPLEVPVTQAVIYGWYDNELGSYASMLGDLVVSISEKMF
ncbi:MAG: glyceraldehyde-3-phosphate dehydrogenase [Magnetococcales bacterium]|nr:glyceraldehyde-3-phosphate dehydrogenase [Magnetococcales bacterium]